MNKHGWTYKKLGDCLSYIKNGANIKQAKGASGIPITRIETLSGGVFNRDRLGYADIFSTEGYIQYIMDDGDILMSHINSKAYIGRSVLYRKNGDEVIIHGMNLLRLKVIPTIITPSFINTYFKSNKFKDNVARIRKDAVNQSSMAITDLKRIPIPVPPIAEQERIVAELDLLSGIIEKKKEQLKAYDQLARSIFYSMFGDPITNPKGWEVKKLGDVCEYAKTRILSNDISVKNYISVENLLQNCQGKTIATKVPKDIGLTKFIESDILIGNIRPYLRKIWLADCQGGCNGDVLTIRRKTQYVEDIDALYLFKCLSTNSFFEFAMQYSKGEKMPRGDKKEIMKYRLFLPPLSLQQQFAERIEGIEAQKALIQQSIKETETLFNSRMDYYFN